MRFTESKSDFGPYPKLTVTTDNGASFSVIPEMGARLNNFVIQTPEGELDVIDGYASIEDLKTEYYSKSSLLAPFPNRVADGKYEFEGKSYQLEINKPDEQNAIHGFVSDKSFSVLRSGVVDDKYELVMEYSYEKTEGYPFSFLINVTYLFSLDGVLSVQTELTNTDNILIPAGFGWHPYFTFKSNINNLKLRLPAVDQLEVDDRLIPTGNLLEVSNWTVPKQIDETSFDTGFQFTTSDKVVSLIDPEREITVQVDCGEVYEFVQVFTPPWRTSIAVEPMTCAANAFNNGMGLKTLKPSESLSAEFSISILRNQLVK